MHQVLLFIIAVWLLAALAASSCCLGCHVLAPHLLLTACLAIFSTLLCLAPIVYLCDICDIRVEDIALLAAACCWCCVDACSVCCIPCWSVVGCCRCRLTSLPLLPARLPAMKAVTGTEAGAQLLCACAAIYAQLCSLHATNPLQLLLGHARVALNSHSCSLLLRTFTWLAAPLCCAAQSCWLHLCSVVVCSRACVGMGWLSRYMSNPGTIRPTSQLLVLRCCLHLQPAAKPAAPLLVTL